MIELTESGSDIVHQELRVTFSPELFLQRRVWILNFLRKEGITRVLDVGCGEGSLLATLCQPAPWLPPPPPGAIPTNLLKSQHQHEPLSPFPEDDIPNLHIREIHGVDISEQDLGFAVEAAQPPRPMNSSLTDDELSGSPPRMRSFLRDVQRWEEMVAKVWQGGLEVVNKEFVGMECIVGMEVIEHLEPDVVAKFAPVLLGIYHPKHLLITTPSYTFNDRFLPPDAPLSARSGYPDPTGRTERVFRHSDHKFEWTREEFQAWCKDVAQEWGYEVNETTVGRAWEDDPWGRDEELGGATQVAAFCRIDGGEMSDDERATKARKILSSLPSPSSMSQPHILLSTSVHPANAASARPSSLEEIAKAVQSRMEEFRMGFMRVEEIWFEPDISELCGGWIEVLVRAVEESNELALKKDGNGARSMWNIEIVDYVHNTPVDWDEEANENEEWRKRMSGEYDFDSVTVHEDDKFIAWSSSSPPHKATDWSADGSGRW